MSANVPELSRFDPVPEKSLQEMLRNGRAYTNEVKAMADELLRFRQERQAKQTHPVDYMFGAGWPNP